MPNSAPKECLPQLGRQWRGRRSLGRRNQGFCPEGLSPCESWMQEIQSPGFAAITELLLRIFCGGQSPEHNLEENREDTAKPPAKDGTEETLRAQRQGLAPRWSPHGALTGKEEAPTTAVTVGLDTILLVEAGSQSILTFAILHFLHLPAARASSGRGGNGGDTVEGC